MPPRSLKRFSRDRVSSGLFLLLPVLGILAVDPGAFDFWACKEVVLIGVAALYLFVAPATTVLVTRVSLALLVFAAVRGFMLLRSPLPGDAVRAWGLLLALTFVHHFAPSRRFVQRFAPPLLGGVLAVTALYAIGQALSGARQAHAFFANRNFCGIGLAMLLPYALQTRARVPLAALGLLGIAATTSRGGALAGAAAIALWFVWRRPRLRVPVLVGLPALVLAAGLLFGESNTVTVRTHWYRTALAIGADAPLLGEGAGGFAREYPPRRPLEEHAISGGRRVHAVHNDYLESWAEGGVLGLGAHLFWLVAALRALRRNRMACASLLAFAVGSCVDLPLRDPSLLALAFVPLLLVPRVRAVRRGVLPLQTAASLMVVFMLVPAVAHWRADRAFYRGHLDEALRHDPRHEEALLQRGRKGDLRTLIELEPHHAGAHYNLTRHLFREDAIVALRAILTEHDPHHTLTRVRLASLFIEEDPLVAASLLDDAIAADPRPWRPYVLLARIHREQGTLDAAERFQQRAEERSTDTEVVRGRLHLELAHLGEERWAPRRLAWAIEHMPVAEVRDLAEAALARAALIESANPRPKVPRLEGETAASHFARVRGTQKIWRDALREQTTPAYREAFLLAEQLAGREPTAAHFRLMARAARGIGDVARAGKYEARALLLEAFEALRRDDERAATRLVTRARLAYPAFVREPETRAALEYFLKHVPSALPAARRLFGRDPELAGAIR